MTFPRKLIKVIFFSVCQSVVFYCSKQIEQQRHRFKSSPDSLLLTSPLHVAVEPREESCCVILPEQKGEYFLKSPLFSSQSNNAYLNAQSTNATVKEPKNT